MAKVTQESLETNLQVEDELSPEDESNGQEKEKYAGGIGQVFSTVAEAKENPVTLTENGETPFSSVKRKKMETKKQKDGTEVEEEVEYIVDVPTFKLFEVRDCNADGKPVGYIWSRNNSAALAEYAEIELGLEASQYGAKRGRAKVFKPDQSILALANQLKVIGDKEQIRNFLVYLPQYEYVFTDKPMPETI